MKEVIGFLKRLKRNNNRDWFQAHKDEYVAAKEKVDNLTNSLIALVAEEDAEALRLTAAQCTYRIYRDTRFSLDKTPYKTHFGIFINPPYGKKSESNGYYFHIEPGNCFIAAGTIGLPPKKLKAVRQSIYDEIDEYLSIVESLEFKKYFPTPGEDFLKTAPKGFDKNWEHIYYLRPKNFCVCCPVADDYFDTLGNDIREVIHQMHRYNRFVNFPIEDME